MLTRFSCACPQDLDEKLAALTSEVQKSLERAPASFRTSVLSFMGDSGDPPDWKADQEKFTFFAAQLLPLSARDKMEVRISQPRSVDYVRWGAWF